MNYFEEKLNFLEEKDDIISERNLLGYMNMTVMKKLCNPEVLGLSVRIGNTPIVKNLGKLYKSSNKNLSPELELLFEKQDIYLIIHMIGAVRLEGKAKVDELQYHARVIDIRGAQTVDLLPNTCFKNPSFKDNLDIKVGVEGTISASGHFSSVIPEHIMEYLTGQQIGLGSDISLKISAYADLIGIFTCNWKFPVVQSQGISSDSCTWVLNPHDFPLLGDQLLMQTLAVPKGTEKLHYKVYGVCKADKGLLWQKQILKTSEYDVEVELP